MLQNLNGNRGGISDNGWVYEQVCLAEIFKFSTNVIGKLAYTPCYVQYGKLSINLKIKIV